MAIGDAVAVFLGTAETDRQPASGVEEKLTGFLHETSTDALVIYDGSTAHNFAVAAVSIINGVSSGFMITNSVYIRKEGTTDIWYVAGVQTNA